MSGEIVAADVVAAHTKNMNMNLIHLQPTDY